MVSFIDQPRDLVALSGLLNANPNLIHPQAKAAFHVDHFVVPFGSTPDMIVALSSYWYGLFSHRRDRVWKGMLKVDLNGNADDAAAKAILGGIHP